MSDHNKTRKQLIEELQQLRAQLQASRDECMRLEEALQSQRAEQQIIFDSIPAIIWFKDTHNRILRLNQAAAEVMGLSVEEGEGRSVYELNPGEAEHYYQDDLEVLNSGTAKIGIIEPLVTSSGETRWLQTDKIPYRDAEGRIRGVIVFSTDITERKHAEEALEEQRALLRQVIDTDPSFVFVKDREGRFVLVNQALADAYGTTIEGLVGKTDADFNPNLEEVENFRRDDLEVMDSLQEKFIREEVITDADGNIRWLQTIKRPLVDQDGVARRVLGIASDITERKKAEDALREAQEDLERRVEERTAELVAANAKLEAEIAERKQVEESLAWEQFLLRTFMDNVPDAIYFKDTASRFIRISRACAEQWFGLSDPAQAVGKTDLDFFTEESARAWIEEEQRIMQTGEPLLNIEERETRPGQPDTWALTSKIPLRDAEGNIIGIIGVTRDITERKLFELERERLLKDLERRSNQLQTAAEVSHSATGILNPDELLQRTVDLVKERFGLYYVGLFLIDQTGQWSGEPDKWAVLRAGTGEAGRQMLEAGHKLEIGGESMIGWCVANRQARIALDVGEEAVRFDNPFLPETRSEMALPLIARGQVIGAMTVQSIQESAFSDDDVAVLQTMANQVANAIENSRLFEEQQQTTSLLAERVRELNCLNDIGRKIDETPSVPEFLQWVAKRIPPAMRHPDLCVAAIEFEGQVYGAAEAFELPCQMVQSLRVSGRGAGRIAVAYREECEFLDEDSALLGGIARRVSGYIENRVLLRQTQAALAEVETVHRSYLRGRWQDYLYRRGTLEQSTFVYDQAIASDIATPAAKSDSEPPQLDMERQSTATDGNDQGGRKTELVVPIVLRGQTIGVLGLEDPHGSREWAEEDKALVESVSRQLALALENARLLEETQRRAAREQLVGAITARMRETLDMDAVLKTAIREIGDALRLEKVEVRMKETSS
ncbi:MAG: hypothetical protein Kow0063_13210 [Anaerolineae bacterium]